jgi:hypothetical protein
MRWAAFAISWSNPQRVAGIAIEGLAWALALAAKLYSWPAAIALPVLLRMQRAQTRRWIMVFAIAGVGIGLTVAELAMRTGNPLGLSRFDPAQSPNSLADLSRVQWGEVAKITLSSAVWASGPHWNALRPAGAALYVLPLLFIAAFALPALWRDRRQQILMLVAVMAAFILAQLVSIAGYVRYAPAAGPIMPAAGKEGWYWFALAPLFALIVTPALTRRPAVLVFAVLWILGWDVALNEGMLFQDYAGLTSPAGGDEWFRWGPRDLSRIPHIARHLDTIAAGPLVSWLLPLRLVHLGAALAAAAVILSKRRPTEEPS